jgi:hypothetical protein
MSEPALAISFVDPARDVHGTARSGLTLLFEGTSASSHADGPVVAGSESDGWDVSLDGRLSLHFAPAGHVVELSGARAHLCAVTGDAVGARVEGLGTVTQTLTPPRWDELDALRNVSVLLDPEHAALLVARRPVGAAGHGEELVAAKLLSGGELLDVEDARLSTTYDGEGRPRQAGLELWLPGEDFPRRAFGSVRAGASLVFDGLDVHAAVMTWRMDGREGAGLYELTVRAPAPAAA